MERCKICGSTVKYLGTKRGKFINKEFRLVQCQTCFYAFVTNPCKDYALLYDQNYYSGKGADNSIDYLREIKEFDITARRYEWKGILKIVSGMLPEIKNLNWLDYGCGTGGLVRYCREQGIKKVYGYEQGYMAKHLKGISLPLIDDAEMSDLRNRFDIITAIEVIEHLDDPMAFFRKVRKLLKPNGIFFYTTWNSKPFRKTFMTWRYVRPEIHVSYYEPKTMEMALHKCGFETIPSRFQSGYLDILRPRIIKNLGLSDTSIFIRYLPLGFIAAMIYFALKPYSHPIGTKKKLTRNMPI